MTRVLTTCLAIVAFAATALGQEGFAHYPIRPLVSLVAEHDTPEQKTVDFVISANPFPSKTAVFVTGERRAIPKAKMDFIKLWFETRGLPPERAEILENEYRFREGEKEYWLPVLKPLEPFLDKELKKGDGAVLYYFFLGGYSKTEREWVFVVEEFQKVGAN